MTPPRVSVVTATRNRTELLERTLRCIAAQKDVEFEAIISDDGSSAEVIAHHERLIADLGPRFSLLRRPGADVQGTGPAATRNRGIAAARAEFVAFLDDDDRWRGDRYLADGVDALVAHGADYAFGHLDGEREGRLQNPGWVPPARMWEGETQVGEAPPAWLLSRRAVTTLACSYMAHPSNSLIRRSVLKAAGGFFDQIWSYGEDANLMLRVLDRADRVLYVPSMVTTYRLPVHDSVSLKYSATNQLLQDFLGSQEIRLHCVTQEVAAGARAREAWACRHAAQEMLEMRRWRDAVTYACQSLVIAPTPGAARFLGIVLARSAKGWFGAAS